MREDARGGESWSEMVVGGGGLEVFDVRGVARGEGGEEASGAVAGAEVAAAASAASAASCGMAEESC